MNELNKSRFRLVLRIAVPSALLAWLFYALDAGEIAGIMKSVNPLFFLASFSLLCLRNIIGAARNLILLRSRKIDVSLGALSRYYFMGNFFNLFMPEVVGRDLARGYYLYRASAGLNGGVSSIVAERFSGTAAMMLMSFVSVLGALSLDIAVFDHTLIKTVSILFGLFSAFMILLFNTATDRLLANFASRYSSGRLTKVVSFIRDVIEFYRSPFLVLKTLAVSLVFQVVGVVAAYLIATSLGDTTSFVYFLILLPVIWVIGMLPISINGLGLREGSFVLFFGAVGMPKETAMAISLLWFAQNIGLGIIGGIFVVLEKRHGHFEV